MITKRDLRRSRQRSKKEAIRKRCIDFVVSFSITAIAIGLILCLCLISDNMETKPQKLNIQMLEEEPKGREFAWNGEIPYFIQKVFNKKMQSDSIYNVSIQYHYMGNDISVGWIASGPTIMVNNDIYLEKASIYASGDDVVIYGYKGKEFIKATVNQNGIVTETITVDYHIPLYEKPKMVYEIKRKYYLSIGEERLTLYKNWKQVGEPIILEDDTVYRICQNMLYTENGILYMPYIIIENGEEKLYLQEVASRIEEFFLTNTPTAIMNGELIYMDSIRIGNSKFPVVTGYGGSVKVYVPNNLKLYQKYITNEIELTPDMNLGWHCVDIY